MTHQAWRLRSKTVHEFGNILGDLLRYEMTVRILSWILYVFHFLYRLFWMHSV